MKPFVQFMTIENLRVFIDPQAIVAFCEFKFRENDLGLVGTRIEYTGNDSTLITFTVKDPIDAVADALADTPKGINIPALNETLICNMAVKEPPVPASYPKFEAMDYVVYELNGQVYEIIRVLQDNCYTIEGRKNTMSHPDEHTVHASKLTKCEPYKKKTQELELDYYQQVMQEKGAKAAQDRVATVLTQSVKEQEKVLDNLAKILQQPDSRLDFETDTQKKSFNWADYRPLERGEKIYAADKVNVKGLPFSVNPDMIGKSYSSIFDTQVYRQYVFQPGDTVQHIHAYDEPIYKVIKTVEDLSGRLYCVLEGRKQSVRVRELVLYTPPTPIINLQVRPTPTTYRTPPQETPPCNGNGEAQSTEE